MDTERLPAWQPPQPFARQDLERNYIERAQFREIDRRDGRATLDELHAIVEALTAEARAKSDDALILDELRAHERMLREQRRRYDDITKRPHDIGPKGRRERDRLRAEHASALVDAEGEWRQIPGSEIEERVSRIANRSELAIVEAGNVRQLAATRVMRELTLEPVVSGNYTLILYSVPYYAEPVPTVQQMWIEWAMLHASSRLIGEALYGGVEENAHAMANNQIKAAKARMLARGASFPVGAKFYSIKLSEDSARYMFGDLHTGS